MDKLESIAAQIEQQARPPVHLWQPTVVGEIDIKIDAQGFWFHEGDVIKRDALVNLFASILWYEDSQHYLVTPIEKLAINVVDVPYLIHQMETVDDAWVAVTNTHEKIIIGADHPVELRQYQDQWVPYIKVRYDLWARVNRSIYYQWVTSAMEMQEKLGKTAGPELVLCSAGYEFLVAK